jgi:hypothetical protein
MYSIGATIVVVVRRRWWWCKRPKLLTYVDDGIIAADMASTAPMRWCMLGVTVPDGCGRGERE